MDFIGNKESEVSAIFVGLTFLPFNGDAGDNRRKDYKAQMDISSQLLPITFPDFAHKIIRPHVRER